MSKSIYLNVLSKIVSNNFNNFLFYNFEKILASE